MNPFSSSEGSTIKGLILGEKKKKKRLSCKLPSKTVVKSNVIAKHGKKSKQI